MKKSTKLSQVSVSSSQKSTATNKSSQKATKSSQKVTKSSKKVVEEETKSSALQLTGSVVPKRALSAYMFYLSDVRADVTKKNPDAKNTEIVKLMAAKWNACSDAQKAKYQKLAAADVERYQKEVAQYEKLGWFTNAKGEKSTDLFKPTLGDDVVKPKKAATAFMCFSNSVRPDIMKKHPTKKITEIAAIIGEAWNKLSDKQKVPFEKKNEADKVRYQEEMDQLMTRGYFINQDGVKSTDIAVKKKRKAAAPVEDLEKSVTKKSNKRAKTELEF